VTGTKAKVSLRDTLSAALVELMSLVGRIDKGQHLVAKR
jgi:hypothetical protein